MLGIKLGFMNPIGF